MINFMLGAVVGCVVSAVAFIAWAAPRFRHLSERYDKLAAEQHRISDEVRQAHESGALSSGQNEA